MDQRREDLDQRQERHEGIHQRPRAEARTRTAGRLPALAARRGDPEDRGGTRHGSRPRRRRLGRHHPHHAPQAARERRAGVGLDADATERHRTRLLPGCERCGAHGQVGLQRVGMGIARQLDDANLRANRLHAQQQAAGGPVGGCVGRPQRRGDARGNSLDQRPPQPRGRVLLPAPQHAERDRRDNRPHGRKPHEHREPLHRQRHHRRLRGDIQLCVEDRHAGFDVQGAGRLRAPQHGDRAPQPEPHDRGGACGGSRFALPRPHAEQLRRGGADARPREELLAPLEPQNGSQIHPQRDAQRRPV